MDMRFIKIATLSDKTKSGKILVGHNYQSDKIFVISKDFGHFSPTNSFVYFEIPKYDQISILQDSDYFFKGKTQKMSRRQVTSILFFNHNIIFGIAENAKN